MPLAEVVILKVGSAIAKSIFQLWLKDMPVVSSAASSILDMLELRTSDKIAQQKARRQFEAIGEKVGENLLLLFEAEGTHLDEGSQTAVALAVEETFQRASISSRLLAKNNLEPQRLAAYVLTTHPTAIDSFNETEKAFYHRIIKEACEYIVDIASQLPQYSERNFAEILKREDQLLSIAATVLQELRQMRERLNLTVEAERFELEYRRAIARNLDVLQLFGTDVSTANRRHRLSVAYVTLSVKQTSLSMLDSRGNAAHKQGRAEIAGDVVTSVDKALISSPCLLIRGFAGSGKTTLLQWIAVQSASRSFEGELSDWNTTLPFYIRLRQFAKLELPSPEMFPSLIAPAIADTMPKGWVHTELKSNRAIVLVDGLDEVPASQREKVRTWLRELVTTYRGTRFIITSRPHAVEEGWMDSRDFNDAELQPMDIPDIHAFIDHWHNAVREELQEETEKAELPFLAQHLKETVKYNHSIRNLATNPLLCAMLCALNRDRRKQLPADRIELYDACCYLLLERRDKERHIELTDYPSLTYRQKCLLLEDLAYWLMKNGWSEIKQLQADEHFTQKLVSMRALPGDVSGTDVRRLFVERSGIIREPITGAIGFTHRTFQEFLAARAALHEGDIGVLIQNAHSDQWREAIILASGLATKNVREYLLQELIMRGDEEKEYQHELHLLAVNCLETSVELGQNVMAEVEKRLSKLVPPENLTDVVALASAGELAIPYLSKSMHYHDSSARMCIQTLALIGSEAALEALEEYAHDASNAIVDELVAVWNSFDREIYARSVLAQALRGSCKCESWNLRSLEGFQYLTRLTSLDLAFCEQISDLRPLSALTQLVSLNLSTCKQISKLRPLAYLTQLTSLDLSFCYRISDLNALEGLNRLETLILHGISHQLGIPQNLKKHIRIID